MRKKAPDIVQHSLSRVLLDAYTPLMQQRQHLKPGETHQLQSPPDWEIWTAATSFFHLSSHIAKLDHCAYYLKSQGKSGRCPRGEDIYATAADWIDYHIGYFYTLHRSIYDCVLFFTHNLLGFQIPSKQNFEGKFLKQLSRFPKITDELGKIKTVCEKYGLHRNDHLHRGAYIQAAPITGNVALDKLKAELAGADLILRIKPELYGHLDRVRILRKVRLLKGWFLSELLKQITEVHEVIWKYFDVLEPYMESFLRYHDRLPGKTESDLVKRSKS